MPRSDWELMDLSLDEMAQAAVAAAEAVVVSQTPPGRPSWARDAEPLGHDPKLWTELCSIGLPGLAVAEELGGGGGDLIAPPAVAQELGTILAPVPLNEHGVAVRLISALYPAHPDLEAAVAGDLIATIAPRVTDGQALAVPAG